MTPINHGRAYFAVKCKSLNAKQAPTLVAFVESYDAAIKLADCKNSRDTNHKRYFATVHTTS